MKVGKVEIDYPVTIPSGIITTTSDIINRFAEDVDVGFLTTKSIGPEKREGHLMPVINEYNIGATINAVGLTNPGADAVAEELKRIYPLPNGKKLVASIFGKNKEEFVEVAKKIAPYCDIIEANYSCPHASGYGAQIFGCDPDLVREVTIALKKAVDVPVIPKLTPNIKDIKPVVKACLEAGADAITAVNTIKPQLWTDSDGDVILSNGPGGLSGPSIFPITRKYIRDIAEVINGKIPINACGGIRNANDIRELKKIGATMFGIGSALVDLDDFSTEGVKRFFSEIKSDLKKGTNNADELYRPRLHCDFETFKVVDVKKYGSDLIHITFDKSLNAKPGQFIFTWLPSNERNKAEKPFSFVTGDPLMLLVKKIGNHTSHIYNLKVGDSVKIRGPYGKSFPIIQNKKCYLIAGGTGAAPMAHLAEELTKIGNKPTVFYGAATKDQLVMKERFEKFSEQTFISTNDGSEGVEGFITGLVDKQMSGVPDDAIIYVCGPEIMAKNVIKIIQSKKPKIRIVVSVERYMKCGIGLCGSCAIDGKRACIDGPVFDLVDLKDGDFCNFTRNKYGERIKI